ncbi:hypothetical protein CF055_17235 [Clostridium botulinum]
MYKYFISYCINLKSNGWGFGNAELQLPCKINKKEILDMASRKLEKIQGFNKNSITIINFKEFEEN